ncbi:MAG: NfeD family protein [Actinomycetota bacterium]
MRRAALFMLLLALCVWPAAAAAAPESTGEIIKVDGSIDRTMAGYLTGALDQAERDGSIVVIQLDTAGTLDRSAFVLAQRIFESRVPVIVWVGPAPAKASGAGLLFMYAASLAAVSPGSQTGPLEPLDLAHPSTEIADLEPLIHVWLRARGKTTMLPVHDRPLTAAEALDHRIAQVAALSIPDLLNNKINGMTVQTAAGPVRLVTRLANDSSEPEVAWRFHDLGPVGRVLHAMASPSAIYLLLVLGFAALAFELTQPGFGFAGFAGVGMLALAIYGLTVVPASWLGIALLVAGLILLSFDVRLRRLGPLTALGLAAFLAGSLLAFGYVAPIIDLSPWLIGSLTVASLIYYGFILTVALQSRDRLTFTRKGLVGLVGETRGELEPEGPVFVKGSLWRGRSADGPIPPGTRIRVRGIDGLTLRVEPDPGPKPDDE